MPDLGPHAVFIWAAYGVTFLTVAALILFIAEDDRRQRRTLAALERQGITRRSATQQPVKPEAKPQTKSPAKPQVKSKPKASRQRAPRKSKS